MLRGVKLIRIWGWKFRGWVWLGVNYPPSAYHTPLFSPPPSRSHRPHPDSIPPVLRIFMITNLERHDSWDDEICYSSSPQVMCTNHFPSAALAPCSSFVPEWRKGRCSTFHQKKYIFNHHCCFIFPFGAVRSERRQPGRIKDQVGSMISGWVCFLGLPLYRLIGPIKKVQHSAVDICAPLAKRGYNNMRLPIYVLVTLDMLQRLESIFIVGRWVRKFGLGKC